MKITFIYPSLAESGFNRNKKVILFNKIPHGFCCLSAMCKKEGFNDIDLIDLRMLSGWKEFRDKIKERKPDVAGITSMSPDYKYVANCIDIIKDADLGIKIVIGGIHPTVKTEDVLKNNKIDYVIKGEGELSFVELLRKIEKGLDCDRLIEGKRADVDELPFIDRELFDCLEMPQDFFLPPPFITILAGRGCSYSCKFCSPVGKIMHGPKIRRRSVGNVINELKMLRESYGFSSLMFWDDCFADDKQWVMEFCDAYRGNKFRQPFVCQMRADIISNNSDMMHVLRKTGLVMAFIGFESGNDRVLKFSNKHSTVRDNFEAARICKKLGIKIWAFLMFGMPTETNNEALDTLRMIRKIRPYRTSAAFFTPHPGSVFYDYCKKNDISLVSDYEDFVPSPENDRPKIKNIDYEYLRKLAIESKKLSKYTRIIIRMERLFAHRRNKDFRIKFKKALAKYPNTNKMSILRKAHLAGGL